MTFIAGEKEYIKIFFTFSIERFVTNQFWINYEVLVSCFAPVRNATFFSWPPKWVSRARAKVDMAINGELKLKSS